MNVNRRDSLKDQGDTLRKQEPADLQVLILLGSAGIVQGIIIIDIQFVGDGMAVLVVFRGDIPPHAGRRGR